MHRFNDRFLKRENKSLPPAQVIGEFYNMLKSLTACRTFVLCFDTRRHGCIETPRLEVGLQRYGADSSTADDHPTHEPLDPAAELEGAAMINPLEAEARSKLVFRSFLARGVAKCIQRDMENARNPPVCTCTGSKCKCGKKLRCNVVDFAVLSPDNRVYGTSKLAALFEPSLQHSEADTRIPSCIAAMLDVGLLSAASEVAIYTNDLDILTIPCVLDGYRGRSLKALHLHRPPTKKSKDDKDKTPAMVIDLLKLKRVVETKMTNSRSPGWPCNYSSWIFWLYLFHKSDYAKPPPGFGVIGANAEPVYHMLTLTDDGLLINRRVLRSFMLEMPASQHALVLRHFTRTIWAVSFYLLLQFPSQRCGWTNVPFEFTANDVFNLNLSAPLDRSDDGLMTVTCP